LFGGDGCKTALESALRLREIAHASGLPVVLTEVKYRKTCKRIAKPMMANMADGGKTPIRSKK